jgi:hypothetical protein
MTALLVGYARVSTVQQDLTSQRDGLAGLGVAASRIYVDHGLTGTNRERPGLREALAACREGDTLVVTKLDRLARSLPDAWAIADELTVRPGAPQLGRLRLRSHRSGWAVALQPPRHGCRVRIRPHSATDSRRNGGSHYGHGFAQLIQMVRGALAGPGRADTWRTELPDPGLPPATVAHIQIPPRRVEFGVRKFATRPIATRLCHRPRWEIRTARRWR